MDDAGEVDGFEGGGELVGELVEVDGVEGAAVVDLGLEGAAFDELGDDERAFAVELGVEDAGDGGVAQLLRAATSRRRRSRATGSRSRCACSTLRATAVPPSSTALYTAPIAPRPSRDLIV